MMKSKGHQLLFGAVFLVILSSANVSSAFYNPATGRWLNRDPIGENGGKNVYAIVANRPIDRIDKLGLRELIEHNNVAPIYFCPSCTCKNIAISFKLGGDTFAWGWLPPGPQFNPDRSAAIVGRFGNDMKVTWTVGGNPWLCNFNQEEEGKWTFKQTGTDNPPHTGPANISWDVKSTKKDATTTAGDEYSDGSFTYIDHIGHDGWTVAESGSWTAEGSVKITFTCQGSNPKAIPVTKTITIEAPANFEVPSTPVR